MYTRSFDVLIGLAVQKFASSLAGEWPLNKFVYRKRLCKPFYKVKALRLVLFVPWRLKFPAHGYLHFVHFEIIASSFLLCLFVCVQRSRLGASR